MNQNNNYKDIMHPILTYAKLQSAIKSLNENPIPATGILKYLNDGPACVVCGRIEFVHPLLPSEQPEKHPYCRDNLEYLAWKYESKNK